MWEGYPDSQAVIPVYVYNVETTIAACNQYVLHFRLAGPVFFPSSYPLEGLAFAGRAVCGDGGLGREGGRAAVSARYH